MRKVHLWGTRNFSETLLWDEVTHGDSIFSILLELCVVCVRVSIMSRIVDVHRQNIKITLFSCRGVYSVAIPPLPPGEFFQDFHEFPFLG